MFLISFDAYRELEEAVGPENASREPAVLEGYAWQPTINDDPCRWVHRPLAVVMPASAREVQEVVRACNRHLLGFKAFSTGWGVYSGPTRDDVVQLDLRRMDRILEIDERNMYAVVEPYVCGAQLQAEAMKCGLNTHIIGAGPVCSPLASATSFAGVGWDCIYMSYSARNVLGVEWVLPDGEILRLGSCGSGGDWFCGDGPGPSLRGIMRGSIGALSGLGIFTKCALKLYNWPWTPQVYTDGLLLDARSEVPDEARIRLLFFPDRKNLADATYKIGEAEMGYLATRFATSAFVNLFTPRLQDRIIGTSAVKDLLSIALKWAFMIVLAAGSRDELEHQEAVLDEIVDAHGGVSLEMTEAAPLASMVFMNFLRVTAIPLIFRRGGLFSTALDRNETWDTQLDWAEVCEEIKRKWIDRGGILDDMADFPGMALYENNMWAHCEELFQYDPRNPDHLRALEPMFIEFSIAALERCMEPFSSTDARLRKLISPMMGHYNRWQKDISRAFDPASSADAGMYTGEVDFDFSRVEPAMTKRFMSLLEGLTWTELGPPECPRGA